MTACSAAAVGPSPSSSSTLPWDSDARQASSSSSSSSASNVGLSFRCSSSAPSLAPGGCPLSISVAVSNPSFFRIAHRRRKYSSSSSTSRNDVFVVRASSSTFELEEEQRERHGFQTADPVRQRVEAPVIKGRVAWSADGKPKILWGRRKPQGVGLRSREEHQGTQSERDSQRTTRSQGPTRNDSHYGPPVLSAGEHKTSSSVTNHQGASAGEDNNSVSVTNYQAASAGEHIIRISVGKRHGTSAGEPKDPFSHPKWQAGFTSSHRIPERSTLPVRKQIERSDSSSAPAFQIGLPAFQEDAEPDSIRPPTLSVMGSETWRSRHESSLSHEAPFSEEGPPQSGSVFTSRLEEILEKFRTRPKWRGKSFEEEGAAVTRESSMERKNINRSESNDSQDHLGQGFQSPNYEGSFRKTPTEKEDVNDILLGQQRDSHGERRSSNWQSNARRHQMDQLDSSSTVRWEVQRAGSPASEIQSPVRKGSRIVLERQAAKTGSSQHYAKNAFSESKPSGRGTSTKKPETKRERRMKTVSQIADVQKFVDHRSDIDAEGDADGDADTTSLFTWSSDDEDSCSVQNEKAEDQMPASSGGFIARRSKRLVKDGKASWHSHSISSLPFEFQYSYSESPNAPIVRYREKPFSPFGPETMPRPWTGGRPLTKSKKNLPVFDSFNPPPKGKKGIKYVQDPGPYPQGQGPKPSRSRDEILGEPLTAEEIVHLVDRCQNEKRQLNLGRDGLTHNMLDVIHSHWKRRRVVKIRCLGVPTVDMDNVCFHLENKTGGKIILRSGGVVYLFRGRNYNYKDRPHIPLMLWKPPTPVYPKLIKPAPEGLTVEEANRLRRLGQKVEPLCALGKNGVYLTLVSDVRAAFKIDKVVRVDCRGLDPSDYKKIGAKLRDLVPCVLLSFDDEQILMWKGKETGSTDVGSSNGNEGAEGSIQESSASHVGSASSSMNGLKMEGCAAISKMAEVGLTDAKAVVCINQLWEQAISSGVAIQLEEVEMDHDIVAKKASELANAVPVVEEYTKQLLRKLQLRKERIQKPDDELRMHFNKLQKLKTEKMLSKGLFRTRKVCVPEESRPEVPQNTGLPVDELARLLSMG